MGFWVFVMIVSTRNTGMKNTIEDWIMCGVERDDGRFVFNDDILTRLRDH